MKRTGEICLIALTVLITALIPGTALAASKTAMPTSVITYSKQSDRDDYEKKSTTAVAYDKAGRISKISMRSHITDANWYYKIKYKKSGNKTIATAVYYGDDGTDQQKYTFRANGLLDSSPDYGSCTWDWFDKKKTKPEFVMLGSSKSILFTKKGIMEGSIYYEKKKIKAVTVFAAKNGQITKAAEYCFSKPVSEVTDSAMKKADVSYQKYTTKTRKITMSTAVLWMNRMLLQKYVYNG